MLPAVGSRPHRKQMKLAALGSRSVKKKGFCSPSSRGGREVPALVLFGKEGAAVGTGRNVPSATACSASL